MTVTVTVELDVNEISVAYEYGLEIADVQDFVREAVQNDVTVHYSNLGWLR